MAVQGLRLDRSIPVFTFLPSVGIMAAKVETFGLSIKSFRVPLERSIDQVLIPRIVENFNSESDGEEPWPELSEYTVERRGSDHPILQRSGKLFKGMQARARWSINSSTATIKELPSSIWYGNVHQAGYGGFSSVKKAIAKANPDLDEGEATKAALKAVISKGSGAAKVNIPARPFVTMTDDDADKIHEVFGRWLSERALAAGITLRSF